jgi:hypothetical protein
MGTNMALEHVLKTLSPDELYKEMRDLVLDRQERKNWLSANRLSNDARLLIEDELKFIDNSIRAVECEISRRIQEWNAGGTK